MSEVKYYDGGYEDIILSIPTNTVEMTVKLKLYEKGGVFNVEQTFDLEDIKYAENLFEQCCNGEYPVYTLTEKARNILKDYASNIYYQY